MTLSKKIAKDRYGRNVPIIDTFTKSDALAKNITPPAHTGQEV